MSNTKLAKLTLYICTCTAEWLADVVHVHVCVVIVFINYYRLKKWMMNWWKLCLLQIMSGNIGDQFVNNVKFCTDKVNKLILMSEPMLMLIMIDWYILGLVQWKRT